MTADVDLSKDFIINNKYKLIRKIGSGSFGTIYLAVHLQKGEEIAVKMESANARHPQLHHESNVYRVLGRANGIPAARFFGVENGYNCLVMELLGPSLEDLFNRCSRRFSLKTSLMLMEQMIRRIELIHTKNYAYRDVKPDNFMMGIGASSNKLFLVDFGLAKAYRDARTHAHIPFTNKKSLTGTARYASINSHQGFELSRRDDMESLAYIMVYFLKGRLPWQGIQENDKRKKYAKICEKKMQTSVEELCGGLPVEFGMYLHYCRRLKFYDEPDYEYCSKLFRGLFHNAGYVNDYRFDWSVAEERSASVQSVDPSSNQHPTHKANRY